MKALKVLLLGFFLFVTGAAAGIGATNWLGVAIVFMFLLVIISLQEA